MRTLLNPFSGMVEGPSFESEPRFIMREPVLKYALESYIATYMITEGM